MQIEMKNTINISPRQDTKRKRVQNQKWKRRNAIVPDQLIHLLPVLMDIKVIKSLLFLYYFNIYKKYKIFEWAPC